MYNYNQILHLDFESSSLCNALCAICNRRHNGGVKTDMVETYVTLKQFTDWFPQTFLRQLSSMSMCGNYGDSMTNPELLDIMRYTKSINPNIMFTVNTNASGRTPEFWTELSELIGPNGHITFSVDGLANTNWIYRRGTHWDKIMMAMENYKKGPGGSEWHFLVFKHNQHQIEEARALSKSLGIDKFYPKQAFGFNDDASSGTVTKQFNVYNDQDNKIYSIEAPTDDEFDIGTHIMSFEKADLDTTTGYKRPAYNKKYDDTTLTDWEIKLGQTEIKCQIIPTRGVFVSSEGLVFPCCMTAGKLYAPNNPESDQLRKFVSDIGRNNMDLNHTKLQNIVDGDIFQHRWPDTWQDNNIKNKRLRVCSMFCGVETNATWKSVASSVGSYYGK